MTSTYRFFAKWGEITPEFKIGDYIIKQVNNNDELDLLYAEKNYSFPVDKDDCKKKECIIFTIFDEQYKLVGVMFRNKNSAMWEAHWSQTLWIGDDHIDEITDATEMPYKDDYRRLNHEVENVFYEINRLMNLPEEK